MVIGQQGAADIKVGKLPGSLEKCWISAEVKCIWCWYVESFSINKSCFQRSERTRVCVRVCRAKATLEGPFKSSHHSHSLLLLLCIVLVLWSAQQSTSQNPCVYAAHTQCVGAPHPPHKKQKPCWIWLLFWQPVFSHITLSLWGTQWRSLKLLRAISFDCVVTQFSSRFHAAMISL